MRIRVALHGWFRTGVDAPDGLIELTMPEGSDVAGVIEALRRTSPLLDPRACLAMIDGTRVEMGQVLKDGAEVNLYPLFSGG